MDNKNTGQDSQNFDCNNINNINDSIVRSVVKKFIDRSEIGQIKYGTSLDRDDLTITEWLTHAQEELMDAILYFEKLKKLLLINLE